MTVLQALRIYGPCSIAELVRRLGRADYCRVRVSVSCLVAAGLVVLDGPRGWDVSDAGRAYLERRAEAARARRAEPPLRPAWARLADGRPGP